MPQQTFQRRSLSVFGQRIPLFWGKEEKTRYDVETQVRPVRLLGMDLPISVVIDTCTTYTLQTITLSQQELRDNAMKQLEKLQQQQFADAKILERSVEEQMSPTACTLTAHYLCEMDIAKEQEILLEE